MNKLIKQDSTNPKSPWTAEQVALIANTVAKDATQEELKMFLVVAARSGLDPFTKQIYFIKGKDGRVMMQASIDGFRVVAQRSKDFAGQGEPEFTEEDGKLIKCTVRVYRFGPSGQRYEAAVGVAYWNEYYKPGYNGKQSMWDKMPHTMLAKVAEALALRKAFPNDLSGLYAQEEMDQAQPSERATALRDEVANGKPLIMTPDEYSELPQADKDEIHEGVKANNRRRYQEQKNKTTEEDIPVINADAEYDKQASAHMDAISQE